MKMEYWFILVLVVAMFVLHRRYKKLIKEMNETPAARGILEFRGDCVYVSPMAILTINDEVVDVSRIKAEKLDRVVRLRMVEIFDAINDPIKRITDEQDIAMLKRMATVHSAITGTNIHRSLFLLDKETKRFFVGVQSRQELVRIEPSDVPLEPYTQVTRNTLRELGGLDFNIRQEFMNAMGRNEYDYFHTFVTKVRRRVRKHRFETYTDEQIQSVITGFAARLGFMIPRSYIRIDETTSAIVHWDQDISIAETSNVVQMHQR